MVNVITASMYIAVGKIRIQ